MTADGPDPVADATAICHERPAEAYRMLLPLAEAGDAEAQAAVGSLVMCSIHRFESIRPAADGSVPAVDDATAAADRDLAARYLSAASAAGVAAASFNFASLHVSGYGGSWEVRKARAAELYELAYKQGFTAFGWLMNGDGAGQPYLDVIERHGITGEPVPSTEPT